MTTGKGKPMKTKTALCLTILVILVCAMNMAMVWQLTHIRENRTVETTATAANVDQGAGTVCVTKPTGTLYVPDVLRDSISPETMASLVGQKVYFRMTNSAARSFAEDGMGDIVALRTDAQDIFTLDDYNRAMQADNAQGWPVWFMIEGALLALLLYFVWKLRKEKTTAK